MCAYEHFGGKFVTTVVYSAYFRLANAINLVKTV